MVDLCIRVLEELRYNHKRGVSNVLFCNIIFKDLERDKDKRLIFWKI